MARRDLMLGGDDYPETWMYELFEGIRARIDSPSIILNDISSIAIKLVIHVDDNLNLYIPLLYLFVSNKDLDEHLSSDFKPIPQLN